MRVFFLLLAGFLAVAAPCWADARADRIAEVKSAIEQKRQARASLEAERQQCEADRAELLRRRESIQNEGYRIRARIEDLRGDESTAQAELYHADRLYGYYQADARAETERRIYALKDRIERIHEALNNANYRQCQNEERLRECERRANEAQSRSYELLTYIERTQADIDRLNGELYNLQHP